MCLTDISCFATHKNGIILFKVQKNTENINPKSKLGKLGIKIPLSKIPILGDILF